MSRLPLSNAGVIFSEIYPTYDDFNQNVIIPIQNYLPNSNFYSTKNPNRLTSFTAIYNYLKNIYSDRPTRFITASKFTLKFISVFMEYYPALYLKQLTFVKEEYDNLINKEERDQSHTEHWSMQDVITIARQNNEAFTNVGAIGDDTTIMLDPKKDKIYQKTGSDDTSTNTTKYGKMITREDFNLFSDMRQILDANIYFGLQEFSQHFINLFQQYF